MLRRQVDRVRLIYREYPSQFWVLILGTFIDRIGGALIFPFFTLYITKKFSVGMTEVGGVFGLFSVSTLVGSALGGALSDRFGRKGMVIFGLVASALSSLMMGLADSIGFFLASTLVGGMFAHAGAPARQAMVADLLPVSQRTQGFSILRVAANLAVAIGPAIGGLLAAQSYLLLFISDMVSSLITATIVALVIRETRPTSTDDESEQSIGQTFRGYRRVLQDGIFVLFMLGCVLRALVAMQLTTTLPVYLQDIHGVSERGFGYLLSLNAGMVVLLQFPIARRVGGHRPLIVMAAGMVLYALGFGMYSVISAYILFLAAVATLTLGEMLTAPTSQSLVSRFAPEEMRGRYMAIYSFSWVIPVAVGPLMSGVIMDNADPRWVWYGTFAVGLVGMGVFLLLRRYVEPASQEPKSSTPPSSHCRGDVRVGASE